MSVLVTPATLSNVRNQAPLITEFRFLLGTDLVQNFRLELKDKKFSEFRFCSGLQVTKSRDDRIVIFCYPILSCFLKMISVSYSNPV